MVADGYARFRNAPGCGHKTGTASSGPRICSAKPEFWVHDSCPFNVNGLACGPHAKVARQSLYAVTPILKEH